MPTRGKQFVEQFVEQFVSTVVVTYGCLRLALGFCGLEFLHDGCVEGGPGQLAAQTALSTLLMISRTLGQVGKTFRKPAATSSHEDLLAFFLGDDVGW